MRIANFPECIKSIYALSNTAIAPALLSVEQLHESWTMLHNDSAAYLRMSLIPITYGNYPNITARTWMAGLNVQGCYPRCVRELVSE